MSAPACWADPLSRAERRLLAGKLARACRLTYSAARVAGRTDGTALSLALTKMSADMSDLHLDVTERAEVATS